MNLERIKKYLRETSLFYLGITVAFLIVFSFVFLFQWYITYADRDDNLFAIASSLAYILSFAIPLVTILSFVKKCFDSTQISKAIIIMHAYIGLILVFSCFYFFSVFINDFNDSVFKYNSYTSQVLTHNISNSDFDTLIKPNDSRAFRGMERRLWTGIDYPDDDLVFIAIHDSSALYSLSYFQISNRYIEGKVEIPSELINILGKKNLKFLTVVKFIPKNVLPVYLDCLYFSGVTIATIGYGDISPANNLMKISVIVEVICGLLVLTLALSQYKP